MEENKLYQYIENLAEKKFDVEKLTPLQLLYAYAAIASMNENVISIYFSEEKDREVIAGIRAEIEKQGLDTSLLKTAIPLIDGKQGNDTQILKLADTVEKADKAHEDDIALTVLQELVKMDLPELSLMKKGRELKDIFAYINHDKKAEENESSEAPAEKTAEAVAEAPVPEEKAEETIEEKAEEKPEEREAPKAPEGEIKKRNLLQEALAANAKKDAPEEEEDDGLSQRERLEKLMSRTEQLYEYLNEKNPGQKMAVHAFVQAFFRNEILSNSDEAEASPMGVLLLAGPKEANKQKMVRQTAEFLDMKYMSVTGVLEENLSRRISGFRDANQRAVILVNDMELLLASQVGELPELFDGKAADKKDAKKTKNRNVMLVFTTDIGQDLYEDRSRRFSRTDHSVVLELIRDYYMNDEKKRAMPTAWADRFLSIFSKENVILFDKPDALTLHDVIRKELDKNAANILETYGFRTELDPKLPAFLLYRNNTVSGMDELKACTEALLKDELFELGRHIGNLKESLPRLETLRIVLDQDSSDEEVKSLFEDNDGLHALYLGDELDPQEYCLPENYRISYCKDEEKAKRTVIEEDIDIVLIDPEFGPREGSQDFLSIDDRKSVGIRAFEQITNRLPQLPVYFVGKEALAAHEETALEEKGAWGFLQLQDPIEFANRLVRIGKMLHTQKKVNELYAKTKTLDYNTAQKISEDGKTAEIHIYDLVARKIEINDPQHMLISAGDRPKERFADVIGAENAKKQLQDFIAYMKNPKPFMMNCTQPPRGVLLYGPPGTGKTMLARAMAGESDASFFAVTGTSFGDKWYGESEKKIRKLFATARRCAPSIIFIDEIDTIGKKREGGGVREDELNTLIAEIDGFHQDPTRPVFVIAATNYGIGKNDDGGRMQLDEALTRRFSEPIKVDLPKQEERVRFLKMQLGRLQKCDVTEAGIKTMADRTIGESLAIMKNILDKALRDAAVNGTILNDKMLLTAMEEYKFGEKTEYTPETVRATAIHEAGHAYVSVLSGEKPSYITVVSRGQFGGYMAHEVREDKMDSTREEYIWRIRTSLAGRAAEQVFYDDEKGTNTGVSSDLRNATNTALCMICLYGMDEERLYSIDPDLALKTALAGDILKDVNLLLKREMVTTRELVEKGKDYIEKMADFLVANNEANTEDIMRIFGDVVKDSGNA